MAPIRRYLRITKYSVLECRIYLDNPALAQSWLLNPRDPVLPRVIESVRPYVLPKLREERERSRKKSTKKRGIKDTVTEDDFEVSIFLTETNTRHSLLYKHKHFHDTTQTKLTSNSSKLTGASRDAPIALEDQPTADPVVLQEEDDEDDVVALHAIPAANDDETPARAAPPRGSKRRRGTGVGSDDDQSQDPAYVVESDEDGEDLGDSDDLFVAQDEETDAMRPAKRRKDDDGAAEHEGSRDDKKKLAMDISYEGFAIYGRVLCLVVKRRDGAGRGKGKGLAITAAGRGRPVGQAASAPAGQAVMENWITSTQIPEAVELAEGLVDPS